MDANEARLDRASSAGGPGADLRDAVLDLSLIGQSEALAERQITSLALTSAVLRRARQIQGRLNCFRLLLDHRALTWAREADAELQAGKRGALLGVPLVVGDDLDLKGASTTHGCAGSHPPARRSCEVVQRLRAAGAVIIGKTATSELGHWPFIESRGQGVVRNPWDPEFTPGGSNGGAAAAVAAHVVAGAVGTDSSGSIRIPAAWCGVVGLKPQRGRIPAWPDPAADSGLGSVGTITRSAADAGLLLDVLHGPRGRESGDLPEPSVPFEVSAHRRPPSITVALSFGTPFGTPNEVDGEIRAATVSVAESLRELGHRVIEADPSYGLIGATLLPLRKAVVHRRSQSLPTLDLLERRTRVSARVGSVVGAPAPLAVARRLEDGQRQRIRRIFERCDVVLTPTTAQPAPRIGAFSNHGWLSTMSAISALSPYPWAWNVTGWPALSLPSGVSIDGLPLGAQLLGREGDEGTLLGLAAQLERHRPLAPRRATDS
jgi:amidase